MRNKILYKVIGLEVLYIIGIMLFTVGIFKNFWLILPGIIISIIGFYYQLNIFKNNFKILNNEYYNELIKKPKEIYINPEELNDTNNEYDGRTYNELFKDYNDAISSLCNVDEHFYTYSSDVSYKADSIIELISSLKEKYNIPDEELKEINSLLNEIQEGYY